MNTAPGAALAPANTVAAVDLGSNSFHMVVARTEGGELHTVDRIKESVRLAAGLDERRNLTPEACERALACLERFGQRVRHLPHGRVRAVGTNTLRRARGVGNFIGRAEAALGHPIEIIYGAEEARLIYGGVVQDLGSEWPRRLVADIGGGSTELVVGELATPEHMESVSLGAVSHTQRYFPDGEITEAAWTAAVLGARVTLEPLAREYRDAGWDLAVGASGSIRAVHKVCAEAGWSEGEITPAALTKLGKALVKAGHVDKLDFAGLSEDRRPIFAGGAALLTGIFESLGIEAMAVSDKALREGLLLDLLGRLAHHDVREESVAAATRRYGVDVGHAERVAATARRLLADVGDWLPDEAADALLRWAALLHEIGLAIAHKGYHKHGEYIVRNADLQGFSQTEQTILAALLRLHRGKFQRKALDDLPGAHQGPTERMAVLLRLAVLLHRGRDPRGQPPPVHLAAKGSRLTLTFDAGWLDQRPLTREDLARERAHLERAGYRLQVRD